MAVDPAARVAIQLAEKEVRIDGRAGEDVLRRAVEDAGYQVSS